MAARVADHHRYEGQFLKTRQCSFFEKGKCTRGKACKFAHGNEDARQAPDLNRTSLCKTLATMGCCDDPNCSFAHSVDELRATSKFYKTRLCKWFEQGRCSAGDQCRHAHGQQELQAEPVGPPPAPSDRKRRGKRGGELQKQELTLQEIPITAQTPQIEADRETSLMHAMLLLASKGANNVGHAGYTGRSRDLLKQLHAYYQELGMEGSERLPMPHFASSASKWAPLPSSDSMEPAYVPMSAPPGLAPPELDPMRLSPQEWLSSVPTIDSLPVDFYQGTSSSASSRSSSSQSFKHITL